MPGIYSLILLIFSLPAVFVASGGMMLDWPVCDAASGAALASVEVIDRRLFQRFEQTDPEFRHWFDRRE